MANTNQSFTELDFNALKNNLINHLRSQPLFKDYDFTGSDLNVLLDVMTKNTEKNAFYLQMAIAEGFLDSAQLSSSVFSHAKELNYTPRSKRSARARVRVSFSATSESQPYIVQKGQSFSTLIKNESYVFSVPETIMISSANTKFSFETDVYEGVYVKDVYAFNSDEIDPFPRFKITNKNVDTTSLTVVVYEDGAEIGDTYKLSTTLLGLNKTSKTYFLQTGETGAYEILFGDGILGRVPKEGSTIVLDYRVSNAKKPNGASVFSINFDPTGIVSELDDGLTDNPSVETLEIAVGGAEQESIESVRYYAPRAFQVQERAIVPTDYEILLKTAFPEINAVNVYGGEEEIPPQFGKVIIAVDVDQIDGLPDSKRTEYYNYLRARMPISIMPIFKEPLFTYIGVNSLVRYNVNITASSKERIKTLVLDTISNYNQVNLDDFGVTLRYSSLVKAIDQTDSSIVSNITTVLMYKKIVPTLNTPQNVMLDFGTALSTTLLDDSAPNFESDSIVRSSVFTYQGQSVLIKDDGRSNLFVVKRGAQEFMPIVACGAVNYETGVVSITGLNPDNFEGEFLKIYAHPRDPDIQASRRNILTIEAAEIDVTVESLRI